MAFAFNTSSTNTSGGFGSYNLQKPSTAATTSFGFGTQPAATASMAPTSTTGFPFGGTQPTTTQQQSTGTTGFFGSGSGTGGVSAFGQSSQQKPGTFFFGNTQPTTGFGVSTQPTTGFGVSTQPTTGFGVSTQPTTGFGVSTQPTTGFGVSTQPSTVFGVSAQPISRFESLSQPSSLGSFNISSSGSSAAPSSGSQSTSIFGTNTANPPSTNFGFSQPSSGFGNQPGSTFGGYPSSYGATQPTSTFGNSFLNQPPANSFSLNYQNKFTGAPGTNVMPGNPNLALFAESMKDIKKQYAPFVDGLGNPVTQPTDQSCRPNVDSKFSSVSYKKLGSFIPNQTVVDIPKGEDIDINNPDPDQYYPIKEYGVNHLKVRFDNQTTTINNHFEVLKELQSIVDSVEKNSGNLLSRYDGLRNMYAQLNISLLSVLRKIELVRCHGTPLQASEIRYRENLEKLAKLIVEPSRKLQELMIFESQIDHSKENFVDSVSEDDMEALFKLLDKQRQGIEVLTQILSKDTRDIKIITDHIKSKSLKK